MLENLLIKFLGFCLASAGLFALREMWKRLQYFYQYSGRSIDQVELDDKVMLKGKIIQDQDMFNLVSPLSKKYCVYWQVKIFSGNGKHSNLKRIVQSEQSWRLTDTTSQIIVEIAQAQIELFDHIDFNDYQNIFRHFRYKRTNNFLEKIYYIYRPKTNLALVEHTLKPQDQIIVLGQIINRYPLTIEARKIFDSFFYQIYTIILSGMVGTIMTYFGVGLII